MPRSSKSLAVVEEFDEENEDFEGDADSDDWQPDPDVSLPADEFAFPIISKKECKNLSRNGVLCVALQVQVQSY